jgi:hypothetical protein
MGEILQAQGSVLPPNLIEEVANRPMARNFFKEMPWWPRSYPRRPGTHLKVAEEGSIVMQMTVAEIDTTYPKVGYERGRRPSDEVALALDVLPGYGMVWSRDAEEHTPHGTTQRSNQCRLLGVVSRAMRRHGRTVRLYHSRLGSLVMIREA